MKEDCVTLLAGLLTAIQRIASDKAEMSDYAAPDQLAQNHQMFLAHEETVMYSPASGGNDDRACHICLAQTRRPLLVQR